MRFRAQSGKVPGTKLEGGEGSSRFLSPSPRKEASAEVPARTKPRASDKETQ